MLSSSCYANLGETYQQCLDRYGDPKTTTTQTLPITATWPKYQGFYIRNGWIDDPTASPADYVVVFKTNLSPLTNEQINDSLGDNSQGLKWQKMGDAKESNLTRIQWEKYKRSDGAICYVTGIVLTFISPRLNQVMTSNVPRKKGPDGKEPFPLLPALSTLFEDPAVIELN